MEVVMDKAKGELKTMYYCSTCGGEYVETAMWVDANTDKVGDTFGSWHEIDTNWCRDCDAHVTIATKTCDGKLHVPECDMNEDCTCRGGCKGECETHTAPDKEVPHEQAPSTVQREPLKPTSYFKLMARVDEIVRQVGDLHTDVSELYTSDKAHTEQNKEHDRQLSAIVPLLTKLSNGSARIMDEVVKLKVLSAHDAERDARELVWRRQIADDVTRLLSDGKRLLSLESRVTAIERNLGRLVTSDDNM